MMRKYRYDLYAFLLLGLFYFSEGIKKTKNYKQRITIKTKLYFNFHTRTQNRKSVQ